MKAEKNPFRSSAIAELRYRIDAGERERLVSRLRTENWRGCLLGPEGTGKTTLLENLQPRIEAEGNTVVWVRLTAESKPPERQATICRVAALKPGQVCFFDGGETLGRLAWWRLLKKTRATGGLVATVHRRPHGLPVVFHTKPDLSRSLLLAKELAGTHWDDQLAAVAKAAFRTNGGNVREVFRACYWHCARVE